MNETGNDTCSRAVAVPADIPKTYPEFQTWLCALAVGGTLWPHVNAQAQIVSRDLRALHHGGHDPIVSLAFRSKAMQEIEKLAAIIGR